MSGLPPANVLTYEGQVAIPFINRTFDPNTSNFQFNVPTIWVNTDTKVGYILLAKPMNVADWSPFGGGTVSTESLVPNSGGAVPPTANKINVFGDGTFITTVGNPGTSTLTIEPAGGLTTLYTENSGTAVASAGNLNIVGGTGVTTSGSGNTITISSLAGTFWQSISASQTMAVNTGYIVESGNLSLALPATSKVGDELAVLLDAGTSWTITQGTAQQITLGITQTTMGAGGSLASTVSGNTVNMVCTVNNTHWSVFASIGEITIV